MSRGSILIVDDEPEFRQEFRGCFHDYEATEASGGGQALEILKKPNTIDLVVLDISMPGLSGIETLAEIKKLCPGLPVVMLTASASNDNVVAALKSRADGFAEKPVDIPRLRKTVAELLKGKNHIRPEECGGMEGKIEQIKVFIQRNSDKKVGLVEAAGRAGMTPKALSRLFLECTGTGFSEYRSSVRVKKAHELLEKGYNVNQVSSMLAYSNPESFIRAFKKFTGTTPKQFKKK